MKHQFVKLLMTLALCGLATTSGATRLVHVYTLDEDLSDFASDISLQDQGGVVDTNGYVFGLGEGLTLTSTEFNAERYSVEMTFSIDEFTSSYTKLIDTNDLTSDSGLYIQASVSTQTGVVRYYPEFNRGDTELVPNESIHLVMTRDAQGLTRVYINGVFQLGVQREDSTVLTDTLNFFIDDSVTLSENATGSVRSVRVYNETLTPTQVRALADGGTLLLEKDFALPGDGLITLDVSTNTEWLDLTETQNTSVNSINADVGGWLSAGFNVANRSEFNALWHVAGLRSFNEVSEVNVPGIQTILDLFGCTFSCDFATRSTIGLYRKFNGSAGSVVGIGSAKLFTVPSPVTGEVENCCTVALDRDESPWGVYLLRDAVIADSDGDGFNDQIDNCINQANTSQLDSDGDGYGNRCDGDLNNDGVINFVDIAEFAPAFNTTASGATDLNGDGQTNFLDYVILTGLYLQAPGPSAYHL